jgi:hypothetical protein
LGQLRHVVATIPTPKGIVEVMYTTKPSGTTAEITLPSSLEGELHWEEKTISLHPGHQQFFLPSGQRAKLSGGGPTE